MNYGKLTAGTTKTAIDTAKSSEKGEIITYLSRMGDVLEDVVERHHFQAGFGGGIYILLDRNEGHAKGRIDDLCQPSHFHLLTTKTTEVFHDDCADQPVFYHFLHLLKAFPLKGSTGYAVVYKELRVPKALPTGEVL